MEWLTFFKCYFGIMIPYYVVIILYDLWIGAKKVRIAEETEISYDVQDFLDESMPAHRAERDTRQTGQADSLLTPEQLSRGRAPETVADQAITFSQPPQGQGIPLADFIERAKAMSREIEF